MYTLGCLECGTGYSDDGLIVRCEREHAPALLRSRYERSFTPDLSACGIARYARWLPVRGHVAKSAAHTIVFQSVGLNRRLQTPNLWIAFNGYWPQRGAFLPTGTFKDLETAAVLARFPSEEHTLVSASAGNTAAALALGCSEQERDVIIVVPESAVERLRFHTPLAECVRIVAVTGEATYDDAIAFAKRLAMQDDRLFFEGGAANVARRDGIGTTMLAAAEQIGRLPEYFIQAIGSGSGAIAAHEAALRLRGDGRFGNALPHLMLVQNAPSAPVYESWLRRSRSLVAYGDDDTAMRARVHALSARVLGTQEPPYALTGGLYDALVESDGDVAAVENAAVFAARQLFESIEGIRLESAAAVALAGLVQQLERERIERAAEIVLHLTGGSAGRPRATHAPRIAYAVDARCAATAA